MEDYAKKKKEQMSELNTVLENGINDILKGDNFKKWLNTMNKKIWRKFSLDNALMLYIQKEEVSYALGYQQWKKYGRQVKKGAKALSIFIPHHAYENKEGQFWSMVKGGLERQLVEFPEKNIVYYQIGTSTLSFSKDRRTGMYGMLIKGKEVKLTTEEIMKNFIKKNILNKYPVYFSIGKVFDISDTEVPEFLWMKKDFKKEEMVLDENGEPIMNRKGEYKIINTPERQSLLQFELDTSVPQKDEQLITKLYNVLKRVSEKNNIPVYEVERETDDCLSSGADGYFCVEESIKHPNGYITMPTDLDKTKAVCTLIHEIAHSRMHFKNNIKKSSERFDKIVQKNEKEIQAEAVAYTIGKSFGIELDTSSFQYLAAYTIGAENKLLHNSIEVIYNTSISIQKDIDEELSLCGLNHDLTLKSKEFSKEEQGISIKTSQDKNSTIKEQTRSKNNHDISR